MKQLSEKCFGSRCGRLLVQAFLGAALAAGCGRVKADDTGSETHWLARCDSDAECAEGSCERGVCSRPCEGASDCAEVDVDGVECIQLPPVGGPGSGQSPAASGVCLLQCSQDADCSGLGAEASCRAGRCELPRTPIVSTGTGGQSGTGGAAGGGGGTASGGQGGAADQSTEIPTLCDGSDDVRLSYLVEGGFLGPYYGFLSDVYGHRSFVIDGQCRFWRTRAGDGWVYTGTLDPSRAQVVAQVMGYGHLSDYAAFDDPPCPDGSITTLAAPEGQIRCSCQCTTNPDAPPGWVAAFRAVSLDAQDALFDSGETVTGPARMVLVTPRNATNGMTARTWPLDRDPSDFEFVVDNQGGLFLTESSGVLIEDAEELAALRQFRAQFAADLSPGTSLLAVPVFWSNAVSAGQFDLFLRDEVPEKVRAALEGAAQ